MSSTGESSPAGGPAEEPTALQRALIDGFQRGLPLTPRPYAAMAEAVGAREAEVLEALQGLQAARVLSRVGAALRPGAVGAGTLAAMAVPPERLEAVAAEVNAYREVNHNYQREHHYNLWFVVTAEGPEHLEAVLRDMEARTGLAVLSLPLVEAYHIDLGFPVHWGVAKKGGEGAHPGASDGVDAVGERTGTYSQRPPDEHPPPPSSPRPNALDEEDRRLLAAFQQGLPLTPRPYQALGERAGMSEPDVLRRLERLQEDGRFNRMGLIVRHHELGYRANAMMVWALPAEAVPAMGRAMARYPFVTLCYRRRPQPPAWPYNLFCMIHGRDRDAVLGHRDRLVADLDLGAVPHQVLFSTRRFKQRGAWYLQDGDAGAGRPVAAGGA